MKITERIRLQRFRPDGIILFKEGVFYKAINEGAYLFVHHVKKYKVVGRHYKQINETVVQIGFPVSIVGDLLNDEYRLELCGKVWLCKKVAEHIFELRNGDVTLNSTEYNKWLDMNKHEGPEVSIMDTERYSMVYDEIKNYSLLDKTPVQVMHWLINFKSKHFNGALH